MLLWARAGWQARHRGVLQGPSRPGPALALSPRTLAWLHRLQATPAPVDIPLVLEVVALAPGPAGAAAAAPERRRSGPLMAFFQRERQVAANKPVNVQVRSARWQLVFGALCARYLHPSCRSNARVVLCTEPASWAPCPQAVQSRVAGAASAGLSLPPAPAPAAAPARRRSFRAQLSRSMKGLRNSIRRRMRRKDSPPLPTGRKLSPSNHRHRHESSLSAVPEEGALEGVAVEGGAVPVPAAALQAPVRLESGEPPAVVLPAGAAAEREASAELPVSKTQFPAPPSAVEMSADSSSMVTLGVGGEAACGGGCRGARVGCWAALFGCRGAQVS